MASEAALHGVRVGNRGTFILKIPGLDPNRFWFKIRDVTNAEDRENLKTAGLSWSHQDGKPVMQVSTWNAFIAKTEAQVVDFRYPKYDKDNETIIGEHRHYRSSANNIAVYREFSEQEILFLTAAMDEVAGREHTPEAQELWARLENECGPLLTPTSEADD